MNEFQETVAALLSEGHAARFRATGDSMYPTLRDGDALTVLPVHVDDLRRGDIVLTQDGTRVTAHRIRSLGAAIVTRGDNSDEDDAPLAPSQVLGKVVAADRNGELVRLGRGWVAGVRRWVLRQR